MTSKELKINKKINAIIRWLPKSKKGIKTTVKDVFSVANTPTTLGVSNNFAIQEEDGEIIKILKENGYQIIGKTNLPELAIGSYTFNKLFGQTRNPLNLKKKVGGSSGGEAAAVSAGLSKIGIGTDFGGSVRIPASYCGLYGFVPSELDIGGITYFSKGLPPTVEGGTIKQRIGFLSKDIALIKNTFRLLNSNQIRKSSKIVVGYYFDNEKYELCDTSKRAMKESIAKLSKHYEVKKFHFNHWMKYTLMYDKVLRVKDWYYQLKENPDFVSKKNYGKDKKMARKYRKVFLKEMEKQGINIILTPTVGFPAPNITDEINYRYVSYYLSVFNLIGFSCGSVSVAKVKENETFTNNEILEGTISTGLGMPVGVQVAGVNNEDVLEIMNKL
jgi:Asp-tRNA(Asn)/Glu-tRNA(Gln) amidotransferase A subunit family amidase